MKSFITINLLFFFAINFCRAKDTTVLLSSAMFDQTSDQLFFSTTDGWLFKQGSDTAWAKKNIDLTGWRKIKPTELSAKYADKSGKVECWFRIKIKLDTSFGNMPLGFRIGTWAASDFYIDGNLIASFGNTGENGNPYQEYSPLGKFPVAVNLKGGNEYTIALHFVDYVSPIPPFRLKSEFTGLGSLIKLTGPKLYPALLKNHIKSTFDITLWTSVCTVLCLLFWLLSIQNPVEKNIRLIAIYSTFFVLLTLSMAGFNLLDISYIYWALLNFSSNIFLGLLGITMPVLLANIFIRKISRGLKIFLAVFFILWIIDYFLPVASSALLKICLMCSIFAICFWYVVSSWKKLKGAQWAVVTGMLFSTSWGILLLILVYSTPNLANDDLYITGYLLSFPLSLLVYVSLRFKEIINEVRENAKHVVKLSEEKKEQALNQQVILQEEVTRQTGEIRTTLDNLRSTQHQLIQSEKMASLGELTAGIAHEIQNPLNFVNNFAEVNKELLVEMKDEIKKGNIDEVSAIADDVISNEEKISHHGKRADAIVKGMLQHSRSSVGVKEATDINALADEYLRLSYHGLRAKDKSFNAEIKTDFDNSIGKINIIPQDIGRVLLNLYNNAFYAVNERFEAKGLGYEPTVSVSTKKINDKAVLTVMDNGNGIPQKVVDKIFQPFFTTKPTGQGTGLGLSLSYDIVKAHGGEIKVETIEGDFTEFNIILPV